MSPDIIHSYLVHPEKHADEKTKIRGADIPTSGRLFQMLKGVFEKADSECTFEISFNPSSDGTQNNEFHSTVKSLGELVLDRSLAGIAIIRGGGLKRAELLLILGVASHEGDHLVLLGTKSGASVATKSSNLAKTSTSLLDHLRQGALRVRAAQ